MPQIPTGRCRQSLPAVSCPGWCVFDGGECLGSGWEGGKGCQNCMFAICCARQLSEPLLRDNARTRCRVKGFWLDQREEGWVLLKGQEVGVYYGSVLKDEQGQPFSMDSTMLDVAVDKHGRHARSTYRHF